MENKPINETDIIEIENSPFVVKGAIGRVHFFINGVLLSLTAGIMMKIASTLTDSLDEGIFTGFLSMIALVFALYCIGLYFVNIKKRVTDIRGFVDWAYIALAGLISLIPIVNSLFFIVLALIPRHNVHNTTYHSA
jgi:drug/metabolite transporter (DMT)-like permease